MNREELVNVLRRSNLWTEDRFGHFKREINGQVFRLKVQKISCRIESLYCGSNGNEWDLLKSFYISNCQINENGGISFTGKTAMGTRIKSNLKLIEH